MNDDKCDAKYCRNDAEVILRREDRTAINLCLEHWFEHCDDKPISLAGGKTLNPVRFMFSTESVEAKAIPRSRA